MPKVCMYACMYVHTYIHAYMYAAIYHPPADETVGPPAQWSERLLWTWTCFPPPSHALCLAASAPIRRHLTSPSPTGDLRQKACSTGAEACFVLGRGSLSPQALRLRPSAPGWRILPHPLHDDAVSLPL